MYTIYIYTYVCVFLYTDTDIQYLMATFTYIIYYIMSLCHIILIILYYINIIVYYMYMYMYNMYMYNMYMHMYMYVRTICRPWTGWTANKVGTALGGMSFHWNDEKAELWRCILSYMCIWFYIVLNLSGYFSLSFSAYT